MKCMASLLQLTLIAVLGQEFAYEFNELGRLFNFGPMSTIVENGDAGLGVFKRAFVGFRSTYRDEGVVFAPNYLHGQTAHALQEVGQAPVVQERFPCNARGFGARVFESLKLFGGALAAVEFPELR